VRTNPTATSASAGWDSSHSASSTVATACTVAAIRTAAAQRIEIGFRTGVSRR
jgi:hypothetical protein